MWFSHSVLWDLSRELSHASAMGRKQSGRSLAGHSLTLACRGGRDAPFPGRAAGAGHSEPQRQGHVCPFWGDALGGGWPRVLPGQAGLPA